MSNREPSALSSYNSLLDEHLAGYFASKARRRHLRKAGLITKDGIIVDEATHRMQMARKDQQRHVRDILASEIVNKALNRERMRRYEIEKELEKKYKAQLVQELKGEGYHNKPQNGITLLPLPKEKPRAQSSKQVRSILPQLPRRAASSSVSSRASKADSLNIRRKKKVRTVRPPAVAHKIQLQSMAEVTVRYLGTSLGQSKGRRSQAQGQEVMVVQQHCGGNTLCVFKEILLPNTVFTFISRRHRGLPFGVAFYIDGILDCRLSCCCEYRHKPGHTLGGRSGHFAYVSVVGAAPCYRCQVTSSVGSTDNGAGTSSHVTEDSESDGEEALKSFDIIVTVSTPKPAEQDLTSKDESVNDDHAESIVNDEGQSKSASDHEQSTTHSEANTYVKDEEYEDEKFEDGSVKEEHSRSGRSSSSSSESESEQETNDHDTVVSEMSVVMSNTAESSDVQSPHEIEENPERSENPSLPSSPFKDTASDKSEQRSRSSSTSSSSSSTSSSSSQSKTTTIATDVYQTDDEKRQTEDLQEKDDLSPP